MTAAAEGQLEVVKLLMDAGADPTMQDIDGDTALSFAMQRRQGEVVKYLSAAMEKKSAAPSKANAPQSE
jgi:ankyrin repeat protein